MRKGGRRWIAAVLALLVLLGATYTVYWRHVAAELEGGIAAWAEAERAAGGTVEFSDGSITGFPFAFRRDFGEVTIWRPMSGGTWSATGVHAIATLRPWQLNVIDVAVQGPADAAFITPEALPIRLHLEQAAGQIRLTADGRLDWATVSAAEVTLEHAGQVYAATSTTMVLDPPPLQPRSHRDPLLDLELDFRDVMMPAGHRALSDGPVSEFSLAATVSGVLPFDLPPDLAVAQWAETGGTVELRRFGFIQAPLDLAGEGTLALDHNLQLLGALTIRARGLPETIDLLAANGVIEAGAARTGRLMAEGLAKPDDQGKDTVNVSLTLQQGFAWLGPIRLMPLPVLVWK
ncbi:MAG: DUF2125 domain-containing protein [Rhodospirillaceae bacterium]|nr:DUF2125 domain-containing protein [Rhodospirillaceae bacterium]